MSKSVKVSTKTPSLAQTYRQAANYFVTRRSHKAIQLLDSTIHPASPTSQACDGEIEGIEHASRRLRIKFWCLYITCLDAIANLGPENGVQAVGHQRWDAMTTNIRDGGIWDDVVRYGYHEVEEHVDAMVVLNLALLLLAHAPSQKSSQRRLERWLKATEADVEHSMHSDKTSEPSIDDQSLHSDLSSRRDQHRRRRSKSRAMILEIYALYVLPRTHGWDRTREFIGTTSYLDEEECEHYLQQLDRLRKEQEEQAKEAQRKQIVKDSRRTESDQGSVASPQPPVFGSNPSHGHLQGSTKENEAYRSAEPKAPSVASKNPIITRRTRSTSSKLSVHRNPAGNLIIYIRSCVLAISSFLRISPFFYLRTLLFLVALLLSLTRGDFRERVKRITATGWEKLRETVGMGVKVTYM